MCLCLATRKHHSTSPTHPQKVLGLVSCNMGNMPHSTNSRLHDLLHGVHHRLRLLKHLIAAMHDSRPVTLQLVPRRVSGG